MKNVDFKPAPPRNADAFVNAAPPSLLAPAAPQDTTPYCTLSCDVPKRLRQRLKMQALIREKLQEDLVIAMLERGVTELEAEAEASVA